MTRADQIDQWALFECQYEAGPNGCTFCEGFRAGAKKADANPPAVIRALKRNFKLRCDDYASALDSIHDLKAKLAASEAREQKLVEALKDADQANSFTSTEVSRISEVLFPGVECECDSEGGCCCKFPPGFIELKQLYYHCVGAGIGIDEAIAEHEALKEGKPNGKA
jgi:hypothetical protein